jgi:acetylornithine deacetylase/succinyl-diaminopimelate desuccinylase-like protein
VDEARTEETAELLQAMIRNACVNDGSPESGQEERNVRTLADFLDTAGVPLQVYESAPGRASLVARIEGSDPDAAALCLMGHTDVVPVNPARWSRDPFGGERVGNEIWGRGAVDMLNLTASMAVAFRQLGRSGFRPRGPLIFLAVADEEAGSRHGLRWMADHHADDIRTGQVLTESGGLHGGPAQARTVGIALAEKGVAWRRLRVHGTPGHGSTPFKADNALVTAAAVVQRLQAYRPAPALPSFWASQVERLDLDDATKKLLLDPAAIDEQLDLMPRASVAPYLHACTHTTFSCNTIAPGGATPFKANVIPDTVDLGVDVRTLPGEGWQEVDSHLRAALGDLYDRVDVEVLMDDRASMSPMATPLWRSLQRAVDAQFPGTQLAPDLIVGFTDSRIYRELGATSYGAGLFSPSLEPGEYSLRFHGNDERIDIESLGLTTQLWLDVARDVLGS